MNQSIKQTFYRRFSLILILSAVIISAALIRFERLLLSRDLEDKGKSIAQILSSVTLDAILSHDYATMERYAAEIVEEKFVSGLAVLRNDGKILAGQLPVPGDNMLLTEYPIRMADEPYGVVRIAFSTDRIDTITWRIVWVAVGTIAVLHVIGLFLTNLVLNKTVLKPLKGLQQAIIKVKTGNFSEKIDPTGPREFLIIGDSFNTMSEKLQQSFLQINENRHALEMERKKLEAIVTNIADGLFVTNTDETIVSFNNSAVRISGYSQNEALGQSCEELFRTGLCNDACALRHNGETRENVETTLITKDGRRLDVAVSSAILCDQDGNRIGGVQTFRDITEEKKRHELYCRTEKLAALGQLASGVAHEINNPLGNIIGYAKMIRPDTEQDKIKQRVKIIIEQARKCSDIVKGLLDYSRSSTSESNIVDLNGIIRRVAEVLELEIKKKNIHFTHELHEIPKLMADERKVEQLVMNLALNAIQAVEQDGAVAISTRQNKNMIQLQVKDNGPGILPELRCRIFDPFFTTKPIGEGTGLGLAICAGIIEELNGLIEIDSTDEGVTFVVSIPFQNTGQEVIGA